MSKIENEIRARRALRATDAYPDDKARAGLQFDQFDEEATTDLLSDLMHLFAHLPGGHERSGLHLPDTSIVLELFVPANFAALLVRAAGHFEKEDREV